MELERTRVYYLSYFRIIRSSYFRFDNNFKLIKRKGTIVSVGNASGAVAPFSVPKLVEKNVKLLRPT